MKSLLPVLVTSNHHQADISVNGTETCSKLYIIEYIVVLWLIILVSTTAQQDGPYKIYIYIKCRLLETKNTVFLHNTPRCLHQFSGKFSGAWKSVEHSCLSQCLEDYLLIKLWRMLVHYFSNIHTSSSFDFLCSGNWFLHLTVHYELYSLFNIII